MKTLLVSLVALISTVATIAIPQDNGHHQHHPDEGSDSGKISSFRITPDIIPNIYHFRIGLEIIIIIIIKHIKIFEFYY